MADIPTRKRSCIVTLLKHRLHPNSHYKLQKVAHARKTSFDLQKDLMHAEVHISWSTQFRVTYWRLAERLRYRWKSSLLLKKYRTKD